MPFVEHGRSFKRPTDAIDNQIDYERKVAELLRTLTPKQFIVADLRTDGFTFQDPMQLKEIGELLEIGPQAAEDRWRKAVFKMRKIWGEK